MSYNVFVTRTRTYSLGAKETRSLTLPWALELPGGLVKTQTAGSTPEFLNQ